MSSALLVVETYALQKRHSKFGCAHGTSSLLGGVRHRNIAKDPQVPPVGIVCLTPERRPRIPPYKNYRRSAAWNMGACGLSAALLQPTLSVMRSRATRRWRALAPGCDLSHFRVASIAAGYFQSIAVGAMRAARTRVLRHPTSGCAARGRSAKVGIPADQIGNVGWCRELKVVALALGQQQRIAASAPHK